jgi:hypothetical protein
MPNLACSIAIEHWIQATPTSSSPPTWQHLRRRRLRAGNGVHTDHMSRPRTLWSDRAGATHADVQAWAYNEPWMAASSSTTASTSCNSGFCDVVLWRPLLQRHGDGTSKIFPTTTHPSTPVFYSRRGARRPTNHPFKAST